MARYTGPKCKNCRRFGIKIFAQNLLANARGSAARVLPATSLPPQRRRRISEYGTQLREKQKARAIYGVFERQFRNYYKKN
ncbi:MAG: hypothetical protein CM1200mP39_14230 [Dehalococcoidia bacterium]|nr:MAG: hypothetical protein CM1200mP39_14230 [Dehalococcoidia bacterium]